MKITKSLPTILMCVLVSAALFFAACSKQPDEKIDKKTSDKVVEKNPFFSAYNTPFNVPPFDKIKTEHYMPAFKEGMKKDKEDIDAIISNQEAPTFANTIGALDKKGLLLSEVGSVFFNLKSAKTSPELRKVAKEVIPMLTQHSDDISLNEKLFKKIEAVYEQKDTLKLTPEETTVLDEYYKGFVRDGANLNAEQKDKLRAINKELSLCTLSFGDNILAETNSFKLIIEKKEDLDGLPPTVIAGGAEAAEEANLKGKWLYTIHKPSMIPFLKFSSKRELREKIFKAYINKGDHNDKLDNKKNIARIVQLRLEKAKLLGFKTYAHFVLDNNMAKIPENVNKLLMQVWKPALVAAKREVKALQTIIDKEGGKFKLQPWDWWYYAEKLKKEKYDLDDSIVKPYFKLENVRNGAFSVANKLWGINFKEVKDMPKPHPDATAFQVTEADGTHIGILYVDYFPRASKRGGAWMNSYRKQYTIAGKHVPPVITNVGNFAKPVGDIPSLLSLDNTETLFHEFGHALHGLLSNCKYKSLSGSDVARDFVELPSQIMENWGEHPDVMKMYFKHYETGETMPQDLI
ncbi:MAG: M3 family metallopeptidase, partial [bacterium]|nr:M3 family metallopeptidase [bacterium]